MHIHRLEVAELWGWGGLNLGGVGSTVAGAPGSMDAAYLAGHEEVCGVSVDGRTVEVAATDRVDRFCGEREKRSDTSRSRQTAARRTCDLDTRNWAALFVYTRLIEEDLVCFA
jgi:hypothetical protein